MDTGVIQRPSNSDLVPLDLANENDHYIRAALEWIVTMREAISLSRVDPLAAIISYEDLVRRPRELVRDTLRFCELPASARTEAYADTIVSIQETTSTAAISPFRLPDTLVSAIEGTWSRLDVDKAA